MTPGEWMAFGGLIFTLISAGVGVAWFVGVKVVELVRHLDQLDAGVTANTEALGRHCRKIDALSEQFDQLRAAAYINPKRSA